MHQTLESKTDEGAAESWDSWSSFSKKRTRQNTATVAISWHDQAHQIVLMKLSLYEETHYLSQESSTSWK